MEYYSVIGEKTNYDIHRYLDGPGNNLSEWSDSDPEKQITHIFSQFLVISFESKDLCILSGTPVEVRKLIRAIKGWETE